MFCEFIKNKNTKQLNNNTFNERTVFQSTLVYCEILTFVNRFPLESCFGFSINKTVWESSKADIVKVFDN